jgi:hypothetical protein
VSAAVGAVPADLSDRLADRGFQAVRGETRLVGHLAAYRVEIAGERQLVGVQQQTVVQPGGLGGFVHQLADRAVGQQQRPDL